MHQATLVFILTCVGFCSAVSVYDECTKVASVWCMGMKGQSGAFYKQGCLKDRNCDVVVRGEKSVDGEKYTWRLIANSKLDKPLIRFALLNGVIQPDTNKNSANFAKNTVFLEADLGSSVARVGFVDKNRMKSYIPKSKADGLFKAYNCASGDKDETGVSIKHCAFTSTKKVVYAPTINDPRYEVTMEASLYPTMLYWTGSTSGYHVPSKTYALFREAPHDPNYRASKVTPPSIGRVTKKVESEQEKSGKNLTWLWILLGILALVVIAFILYWFVFRKKPDAPGTDTGTTSKTATSTSSKTSASASPAKSGAPKSGGSKLGKTSSTKSKSSLKSGKDLYTPKGNAYISNP